VVVDALIVCHGQANLILGRWMLRPARCSAAESAINTTDAIALRNISPAATIAVALLTQGDIRERGLESGGIPGSAPSCETSVRYRPASRCNGLSTVRTPNMKSKKRTTQSTFFNALAHGG
jgi:hypothetical protein